MKLLRFNNWLAAAFLVVFGLSALAQAAPSAPSPPAPSAPSPSQKPDPAGHGQPAQSPTPETHITPEQAKELFHSLNEILTFASDDTKLPIRHEVKRRLI